MKSTLSTLCLIVLLSPLLAVAAPQTIDKSVIKYITIEQEETDNLLSHPFSNEVQQNLIAQVSENLANNQNLRIFGEDKPWQSLTGDSQGLHLLHFTIEANRFSKGKLTLKGVEKSSLFLNGEHIKGDNSYSLRLLNQDYQVLLLVSGVTNWDNLELTWTDDQEKETENTSALTFSNKTQNIRASMKHYFDSETVGTLELSPTGNMLVWSKKSFDNTGGDKAQTVFEVIDTQTKNILYRWQNMRPQHVAWRHDGKALVFMHDERLYQLDAGSWQLRELATGLKGIRDIHWLNNEELLVTWHKGEDKPHPFTKRLRALEDRWSYWRGNLQIHRFDLTSGMFKQVTNNTLSSNLLDINSETRQALISRSPTNYKKPPHSLSQLILLNIDSGEETLIGEYRTLNAAHFNDKGYVIVAGPSFHNELTTTYEDAVGNALDDGQFANDYDGQLYLLNDGEITPLSKSFNPSISHVVTLENGDLVVSTIDQDRRQLYQYSFDKQEFSKISTAVEVVSGFAVSTQQNASIVYKGTSATRPQSVHSLALDTGNTATLFDSVQTDFSNVQFPTLKDWDYTTKSGHFIDGRVYYPNDFDENKQYPTIVYYYAGVVPVSRSFTGRWPFSLWASQGYIVYVLQPSGTIGYGQEFSAKHVNAWGLGTADDIIESTKAFVADHPYVDGNRLGNMGASYGGFMTMYLATKTDMFAASISHAGISNLASYWGHGWWGYGYSGIATRGTFPFNNSDFYVNQSPLFAAQNITTPMLLIHGDADTNVPVSESHQMYTALMLQGKDVELVEFQGDDHHINSRERRLRWWETILSYMDMKLKEQPLWWEDLYPPHN